MTMKNKINVVTKNKKDYAATQKLIVTKKRNAMYTHLEGTMKKIESRT